jgi:cobalt/nickel transport protein
MKANTKLFLVAGLLLALALALFVSPFADSDPDGLTKVAEEEGFADAEQEHDLADSPVADYDVRGVDDDRVSTGAAGVIGVLVTFGVGVGAFALLRTLRRAPQADDAAEARAG